ncbi:hypothetical protein Tmath_0088 [Thermoanaerobacter mathranii subsp. mathranii str. A3]|uniref:Uncharacterized protein n=1 Tax=Thermoanaerobacter mathranii subsp. mathranii (strain DSM 11426 / CCUG 53645 / CIP 108742 / A3) TaxID=583358 RepID=A0ABM5LMC2_THEM3|nr:hypothetical protein Tmath_0088 [Thermoanaerobacter mathranii subsp. mathranii str. A3]
MKLNQIFRFRFAQIKNLVKRAPLLSQTCFFCLPPQRRLYACSPYGQGAGLRSVSISSLAYARSGIPPRPLDLRLAGCFAFNCRGQTTIKNEKVCEGGAGSECECSFLNAKILLIRWVPLIITEFYKKYYQMIAKLFEM